MNMMSKTAKTGFEAYWNMPVSSAQSWSAPLSLFRLAAITLGLSLMLATGAAQAGDDDDEQPQKGDESFMQTLMKGIGGQTMDDSSINYRERSPLVVPSKTDLPPPAPKRIKPAANWPKDPDEQARREAAAAAKEGPADPIQATRPLMPSELAAMRKPKTKQEGKVQEASTYDSHILSPSELGFNNGMFSGVFGGKPEAKKFTSEPTRENLTMPPPGYQTPSTNYAYGTGVIKGEAKEVYNPTTDKGEIGR